MNTPFNTGSKDANKPAHAQTVNTADKAVNTDSKIVPAQTSAISPNSNPGIQKTTMADSASLKQTEIENSFTEMKAILEALRKEVRQIFMPAHLILVSQVAIHRHSKGLKMPLLKQCFHLNGLKVFRNFKTEV